MRRAAAEVLGRHPALANIKPLLALRQSAPADDTHLIHVARMALRDQLLERGVWPQLAKLGLVERDRRDIADVATGVHTPQAAAFSARTDQAARRIRRRRSRGSSTISPAMAPRKRRTSWPHSQSRRSGRRHSGWSSSNRFSRDSRNAGLRSSRRRENRRPGSPESYSLPTNRPTSRWESTPCATSSFATCRGT